MEDNLIGSINQSINFFYYYHQKELETSAFSAVQFLDMLNMKTASLRTALKKPTLDPVLSKKQGW